MLYSIRVFRRWHGRFPRIVSPRSFNEKVLWRMLFDRRELLRTAADKLAARRHAGEILGHDLLPELYFVTDRPETIPFDTLPDRFVVKATHGCNWVHLVTDKQLESYPAIVDRCRAWLRSNYFHACREWAYKTITPRILVEEFLGDANGVPPMDFKFLVFDGRVRFIQVDKGRFADHRRSFFDPDWRRLEMRYGRWDLIETEIRPPSRLADMIAAAERLGRGIDFLRADFYDLGERIVFGEITMTPGAGLSLFTPASFDYEVGRYWRLPRRASVRSH